MIHLLLGWLDSHMNVYQIRLSYVFKRFFGHVLNEKGAVIMYVISVITWPTKSTDEIGKAAVEALRNPPANVKRSGPYTIPGGDGIKSYSLWDIEEGHEKDGYKAIMDNYVPYLPIEGFKLTMEVVLPAEEALAMIGLSL